MSIDSWLEQQREKNGLTVADFAGRIGATQTSVYRYRLGRRIPDPETMRKIYEVTAGAVTANDFYGLPSVVAAEAAA